ncbi:MAG: hypothetical protein ABI651_18655, partial [Verrucomicrobiota bacterium]
EDNTFNLSQGASAWAASSPSGFSGTGALQATPNTGANVNTGYAASSPRLDFPVNFVKTGTHYIWIRGIGLSGSDDSCHVGLDGVEIATSDLISGFGTGWTWSKNTMDGAVATFNIASAGIHTVNVWMREDGFIIDKLLLAVNSIYTPTGAGPAESLRLSDGPPLISDIPDQIAIEDTPMTTEFMIADPSATFESLLLTGTSSNTGLVPNANIAFRGCGASRTVTVTPAANQHGSTTITITVHNGAKSASDTFVLTVKPDSDGDGIPDDWELAQGLNANDPSDASIDSDGDGFTNLQEFLAGTAPHDPASALAIADTSESGADMVINFTTVTGRKYRVEHNPAFPTGPWTTVADNVPGTGGNVQVTNFGAASRSKCFYRVTLVP